MRGPSGRIVIEVDPSDKHNLYAALAADGLTLKDWFTQSAAEYVRSRSQMRLSFKETEGHYSPKREE